MNGPPHCFLMAQALLHSGRWEKQLWVEIAYKGGSILTAVWGLSVIICYLLGFWIESLKSVRTFCVMSFLLLALGPGLLVNACLQG